MLGGPSLRDGVGQQYKAGSEEKPSDPVDSPVCFFQGDRSCPDEDKCTKERYRRQASEEPECRSPPADSQVSGFMKDPFGPATPSPTALPSAIPALQMATSKVRLLPGEEFSTIRPTAE
ncbi:hypothetical protein QFC22_004120 [Naganishia vaughanmartiniae]|uniref:Uncharacterized protein n=1 Tax=Naganishia vaughanmartiniae TaxID=1424756 RepID=A0ACC2X4E9_9TREE|nr:hypothetical protein QFC22_004120 [Naganishia vaughanmartiniae]